MSLSSKNLPSTILIALSCGSVCFSSSCQEGSIEQACSVVSVDEHAAPKQFSVAMLQKGNGIVTHRLDEERSAVVTSYLGKQSGEDSTPFEPWKDDPTEIALRQSQQVHGDDATLDEDGYKAIALMRNAEEMAIFVKRVAKSVGLIVSDEEALNRMLPKYDGEEEIRNFASLESDLLHPKPNEKKWLTPDPDSAGSASGKTALLTQAGYFSVAKLRNQEEMKEFARRVIEKHCLSITNEGAFDGLVEWYSGVKDLQDLDSLENEIVALSQKPDTWLARRPDAGDACRVAKGQSDTKHDQSILSDSKLSSRQKEFIAEHVQSSADKYEEDAALLDDKLGDSGGKDAVNKGTDTNQIEALKAEVSALKGIVSELRSQSGKH
mmetsp:Transcript_4738/g.7773  ORF Transcript_4738/g.7773 Transcript_4738/m.7773 type:complete len:379 (-) Transcript_4738:267-1403(-)